MGPYCDVCGGIVTAPPEGAPVDDEADEGLICDVCVRTRRVFSETAVTPADAREGIASRFRCPHCDRRLKTRTIKTRTEVDCPRCKGRLVLNPDGSVEAGSRSWPRPPAKEDKGGGAEEAAEDGDADDVEDGEAAGSTLEGEAARAARDLAALAQQESAAPPLELPSDLAEILATRAAFDARGASDSTELITGAARWAAEAAATAPAAPAAKGVKGSGSSDRVPVASGEEVFQASSSEWPAAPSFAAHESTEAPAAPPAPALAARAEAAKAKAERVAPVVASIAPASPAAPPGGARAPWIRIGIAAALVLGGVGAAALVNGAHGLPGPLEALGQRVGKGFQHLQARLGK